MVIVADREALKVNKCKSCNVRYRHPFCLWFVDWVGREDKNEVVKRAGDEEREKKMAEMKVSATGNGQHRKLANIPSQNVVQIYRRLRPIKVARKKYAFWRPS